MNPYAEKLANFADDEAMFAGVTELLLGEFDLNTQIPGIERSERENAVNACLDGRERLQVAFKKLKAFQRKPSEGKTSNPNGV